MKAAERPLSERENAAWRAFYEMQELLRGRLEQHLQADSGLSNADYTVLVVLSEVPQGQQRAYELSRRLAWEKSRLHHQLTRMCSRGLVERRPDPDSGNARAVQIVLTRDGLAAIVAAAPEHVRDVRQLLDALTDEQLAQLGEISRAIIARLITA